MVEHDEYLKPIITPVYNIGFELQKLRMFLRLEN